MKMKWLVIVGALSLLLAGCSNESTIKEDTVENSADLETKNQLTSSIETEILTGKEFTLTAKEVSHPLNEEVTVDAWTYNGSVPGAQIRVQEGDNVKITLINELPEAVTIHWHGVPVPNEMDGVAGITMNAVLPGKSFTYEFIADTPGTYFYHTHQDAVVGMDKGLYGTFIVEEKTANYDVDETLVFDEWISDPEMRSQMENGDNMDMRGDTHSDETIDNDHMMEGSQHDMDNMEHDMSMYDIYTINGKSGATIKPIKVKEGDKVRLRLVNAGFMSHNIHLHGHEFKVIAVDGQKVNEPQLIKDEILAIAPGERYDIEFTANNPGKWYIECHGDMNSTQGMKTVIEYEGVTDMYDQANEFEKLPIFNFMGYGTTTDNRNTFTLNQQYDLDYTMDLNTKTSEDGLVFTINDNVFPEIETIKVNKGDTVKVKLTNHSEKDDHPMHLHGHFFQVLSKNGTPIQGSPIWKDTINLKPGEEYIVAFQADNPGDWMFHCHDLHHAASGMATLVNYNGFEPSFTPDPNVNNKPE